MRKIGNQGVDETHADEGNGNGDGKHETLFARLDLRDAESEEDCQADEKAVDESEDDDCGFGFGVHGGVVGGFGLLGTAIDTEDETDGGD